MILPPVPLSAARLIIFVVDASRCGDPAGRWLVEDAVAVTVARIEACPGAADHRFAAVVYGSDLVRVVPPGTRLPWDLRAPCSGPARPDGAAVAVGDLAARFLAAAPDGLPGSVDVLTLTAPGARVPCPDDLRVLVAGADTVDDLADEWWARLASLRSLRRHTVILG